MTLGPWGNEEATPDNATTTDSEDDYTDEENLKKQVRSCTRRERRPSRRR